MTCFSHVAHSLKYNKHVESQHHAYSTSIYFFSLTGTSLHEYSRLRDGGKSLKTKKSDEIKKLDVK
jgi:hypothetical protein